MQIRIEKKEEINQKYFNYKIKNLYQIESIFHNGVEVVVVGDFDEQQEQEIVDLYNKSAVEDWHQDVSFMEDFLTEKYELNKLAGGDYINRISAKINLIVQSGLVTLEQAEEYGEQTKGVRTELSSGYWHSAYTKHVDYTPISELQDIHEEVRLYIREYVNEKYPLDFQIT